MAFIDATLKRQHHLRSGSHFRPFSRPLGVIPESLPKTVRYRSESQEAGKGIDQPPTSSGGQFSAARASASPRAFETRAVAQPVGSITCNRCASKADLRTSSSLCASPNRPFGRRPTMPLSTTATFGLAGTASRGSGKAEGRAKAWAQN